MTERSERPTAPLSGLRTDSDAGAGRLTTCGPAFHPCGHGMRYLLSPHGSAVRKHRGNKLTTAERAFPSGRANWTLARSENLAGIYAARQGTTCAAAVDPSCGLSYVLSAERRVANPACAKAWAFLLQFLGAAEQQNLPRWVRGKHIRRAGENITKTV